MSSIAERLDRVERKPVKCALRGTTETFVRAGRLVETAMNRHYSKLENAADDYGTTHSLMSRQLANQDNQHVSFQRLWSMPDEFKLELLMVLAQDLNVADVRTVITLRRSA